MPGSESPGRAAVFGNLLPPQRAETAALVNGILAHALEMDSLRRPGVGVHPATLVPPALALAQERGGDGRALIAAIVAGTEVLIRVGRASCHSVEGAGFHAPGVLGPIGAAAAAGRMIGLDARRMAGIAAARWAEAGMDGPAAVIEGRHGLLNAYAPTRDPSLLTDGLGETFELLTVCFKRYACHVTARSSSCRWPIRSPRTRSRASPSAAASAWQS